ncbi:MAG: His/Gly/Thr/Pro-type tRNA ligase C-terminal domain-containing protein, partial [Clostridia bacterium]|nr:His/Gly/Thr/Pro-type tRNA ligase C-terminal domain-containing protein [Clostridia bacterium]
RGDFVIDKVADIREVTAGEKCPYCGGVLQGARGIEIGQIFKLHDKYSRLLEANYTDEEGVERPAVMGCYGIGVGRTMAAVIEQSNDEYGIIWPMAVAPYQVVVIPVNDKDEALTAAAKKIYDELLRAKVEVVIDDRKERPGVKFNDADLIGYPLRIVVGSKSLAKGVVEVKIRATGETMEIPVEEITEWTKKRIGEELTK